MFRIFFLRIIHDKFLSRKANFKMNKFSIISEAESELEQYKKSKVFEIQDNHCQTKWY